MRESAQLTTVLELYDMKIHQKISVPNCQKLLTMVKRSTHQKLRLRNIFARREKIETGAVVKSHKGLIGVDGGKGTCYQWKKKPVFARRPLQFPPRSPRSCTKKNTLPPRLLSQPYQKVEVCRGREVSEAKVTMGPFFDNRAALI